VRDVCKRRSLAWPASFSSFSGVPSARPTAAISPHAGLLSFFLVPLESLPEGEREKGGLPLLPSCTEEHTWQVKGRPTTLNTGVELVDFSLSAKQDHASERSVNH
jgi:hypothetical protein